MPKKIQHYRKEDPVFSSTSEKKYPSLVNVLILFIFAGFCLSVTADSVEAIQSAKPILEDQSKLCLAEFHQKKCNTLELTTACQQLMDCIQLKDNSGIWKTIRAHFTIVSNEITEDLALPSVAIAVLLLWQLRDALTTTLTG